MQVFLLSLNSEENAAFYVDKHVVKTPAVVVQILLNACARLKWKLPQIKNFEGMPQIPTPKVLSHPLCKWTSLTAANFNFMLETGLELCKEFRLRNHEKHYQEDNILEFELQETAEEPLFDRYPWMIPLAFQDKKAGLIESYRRYYYEAKNHLARWSPPRDVPYWFPIDAVVEGRKISQEFQQAKESGELHGINLFPANIPN